MTLTVDIRHRLGDFSIQAAFESAGRLTALFGPSGSGKTTLINIIGGLIRPREGRVVANGRTLVDTANRIYVPAYRRRVGYVFQDARLFPHLSVRSNLNYGRRFAGRGVGTADFNAVVALLDIGHLLLRAPASLSGGEKQRVAIGRALLSNPHLMLMDEPLASLDDARKAEILPYIERLRDEARVPIVYVSHSVAEVTRLATDIAVLDRGRLAAFGPTADILARLDLLSGGEAGEGGTVLEMQLREQDRAFAMSVLRSAAGEIRTPQVDLPLGSRLRVRLRARDVMIATERPQGISALNILSGTVDTLARVSENAVDVRLDCNGQPVIARITRLSAERLRLAAGQQVFAVVKTVSVETAGAAPLPREDA
ncbi:MAG: molybdenum ABC transporter ATP-binding protein [Rhizobiales bacterium]|nr:molybdenum ABC transporter ATP-binding protein [Hyphomicrobiales bacterium]